MTWSTALTKAATVVLCLRIALPVGDAEAAEIKIVCSPALAPVYRELIPGFERTSGHKVAITYSTAGAIRDRVQNNDAVDAAISTIDVIDDLQKKGKIIAGSRLDVAKVSTGVGVRRGTPKPDISSADAFKKSLLAAKSIGYGDPSAGGATPIYVGTMIERFGIAADMKPKTKLLEPSPLFKAVADGEVEIVIAPVSQIVSQSGVELVGPLPTELQHTTLLTAGLVLGGKEPDAAKALIKYLTSPTAAVVISAKGMEPVTH